MQQVILALALLISSVIFGKVEPKISEGELFLFDAKGLNSQIEIKNEQINFCEKGGLVKIYKPSYNIICNETIFVLNNKLENKYLVENIKF